MSNYTFLYDEILTLNRIYKRSMKINYYSIILNEQHNYLVPQKAICLEIQLLQT